MTELVTFEAVWDGTIPPPAGVVAALPSMEAAGEGDDQVVIGPASDGADREARVSLHALARKPWVTSVVTYRPVDANRPWPHIRSLFDFSSAAADGLTDEVLRSLPASRR